MNFEPATLRRAAIALAIAAACASTSLHAQSAEDEEREDGTPVSETPTSREEGQIPLDESFGESRRQRIADQRRKAFDDTVYDIHLRSFYLDRDKFDNSQSEAWAGGGWVGLKTGWFRDRVAFGVTGYGSFPLEADDDRDGTLLLGPGQEHYEVIGELYAEVKITEEIKANLGRRAYDTPYINKNDSRMTPNTFEAYTITGVAGDAETGEWRFGGGYFDKIKERNSEDFVSMSRDAGADVKRGVYALGGNWKLGELSIGAIDYYSDDIINIFYTEAKYGWAIGEKGKLTLSGQYSDQQSTGDDLLNGSDFDASQWGLKAEYGVGPALFTLAYTDTDEDSNMQAPWSGYPGYTSVQVEDFNRAGERAYLMRVGYNFGFAPGLSAYVLRVNGDEPAFEGQFEKHETDYNLQWVAPEGTFKGLTLRLRYADVSQSNAAQPELDDLRFIIYYDVPGF